jgi:hypothetical protein
MVLSIPVSLDGDDDILDLGSGVWPITDERMLTVRSRAFLLATSQAALQRLPCVLRDSHDSAHESQFGSAWKRLQSCWLRHAHAEAVAILADDHLNFISWSLSMRAQGLMVRSGEKVSDGYSVELAGKSRQVSCCCSSLLVHCITKCCYKCDFLDCEILLEK